VSDQPSYDPRRALSAHRAQERSAWDRFAASALVTFDMETVDSYTTLATRAAIAADALLAERRRRFPGPKIRLEEGE
jgi:hypothetical protein